MESIPGCSRKVAVSQMEPQLEMCEQPEKENRFRYAGTEKLHFLKGVDKKSERDTLSCPKIKMNNYKGIVRLRGMLCINDKKKGMEIPHVHKLQGTNCNEEGIFEIRQEISPVNSVIEIQEIGIQILSVKQKSIEEILIRNTLDRICKLKAELSQSGLLKPVIEPTDKEKQNALEQAKHHLEIVMDNIHKVVIKFEAESLKNSTWEKLCKPIYTHPIYNKGKPNIGDLRILYLIVNSGFVNGGNYCCILCGKVDKDNIEVHFRDDRINWLKRITKEEKEENSFYVHYQYAICFKIPPYVDQTISSDAVVSVQLYRPSDKVSSNSEKFTYKPQDSVMLKHKKAKLHGIIDERDLREPFSATADVSQQIASNCSVETPQLQMHSTLDKRLFLRGEDPVIGSRSSQQRNATTEPSSQELKSSAENDNVEPEQLFTWPDNLDEQLYPDFLQGRGPSNVVADGRTNVTTDEKNKKNSGEMYLSAAEQQLHLLDRSKAASLQDFVKTNNISYLLKDMCHLIGSTDDNGNNAVHLAVLHSQKSVLKKLLELKSEDKLRVLNNINAKNNLKQVPLHIAVYNDDIESIELLIKYGADLNAKDHNGNTAWHIAAEKANDAVLKVLLQNKQCQVNECNNQGLTSLHLAVTAKSFLCVKQLCQAKANLDAEENESGRTALHLAIENDNIQIAKYLLQNDAYVDAQMHNGYSPLHKAVELQSEEIVKLLLNYQADPFLETFVNDENSSELLADGLTAFDLSKNKRITQILQGIPLAAFENVNGTLHKTEVSDADDDQLKVQFFCSTDIPRREAKRDSVGLAELMKDVDYSQIQATNAEEFDLIMSSSIGKYPVTKVCLSRNKIEEMDESVKESLIQLLNHGDKDWRALVRCSGYDCLMDQICKSECPAKTLLFHLDTLDKLRFGLEALDYKEALNIIDSYLQSKAFQICSTQ